MSLQVNFTTHGHDLKAAYESILRPTDPKNGDNWALFGYDKATNDLKVLGQGNGGLEELEEEFMDGKIQYAFVRVVDPNSQLNKFILIGWCGEGVPESKKGLFSSHLADVSVFLKGYHLQINARCEDDVTPAQIMKRVNESSGSKYSVHKETYQQEKISPLQSAYKKTEIPDIAAMQRNPSKPAPAPKYGIGASKPLETSAPSTPPKPSTPERSWKSSAGSSYSASTGPATFNKIIPPSSLSSYGRSDAPEPTVNKAQQIRLEREAREKEERERIKREIEASEARDRGTGASMNKAQQIRMEREAREKEERERIKREIEASEARERQAHGQSSAQKEAEERRLQEQREQQELQRSQDRAREDRAAREREERERADAEDAARSAREAAKAREEAQSRDQAAQEEEDHKRQQEQQQRQREKEEHEAADKRLKQQREEEEAKRRREQEEAEAMQRRQQEEEEEEARRLQEEEEERSRQVKATTAAPQAVDHGVEDVHAHTGGAPDSVSAIVLYSYEKAEENEMSLIEGETIINVTELDVGWWSGESIDGTRSGLFPANYVEVIEQSQEQAAPVAAATTATKQHDDEHHAYAAQDAHEPTSAGHATADDALSGKPTAVALYDYNAGEPNEISFSEGDIIKDIDFVTDDWWSGQARDGTTGLFPSNYVEIHQ